MRKVSRNLCPRQDTQSEQTGKDESSEGGEYDEERDRELERKKARRKKRRLVFDERLGEVVTERRRKHSRRNEDWLDFEEES
jgi:hypothetical protein